MSQREIIEVFLHPPPPSERESIIRHLFVFFPSCQPQTALMHHRPAIHVDGLTGDVSGLFRG